MSSLSTMALSTQTKKKKNKITTTTTKMRRVRKRAGAGIRRMVLAHVDDCVKVVYYGMCTFYAVLPRIRANKANIIRFIVVVFMNRHLSPGLTTLFPPHTHRNQNEKWIETDRDVEWIWSEGSISTKHEHTHIHTQIIMEDEMKWLLSLFFFFISALFATQRIHF